MIQLKDLTPIRVRGRKVRRPEESTPRGRTARDKSRDVRSRSVASSAPSKRQKVKQEPQEPQHQPGPPGMRKLSRLEALPAELIEHIFLECLEFSLPRASPLLAASLTREPLYRALILYALWNDPIPDDRGTPAAKAVSRLFRPLNYVPITPADRYQLQVAVWDCRWCTFDRVKRCLRDLAILSLHRWLYGHGRHARGLQVDDSDLDVMVGGLEQHIFTWKPSIEDGAQRSVACAIVEDQYSVQLGSRSTSVWGETGLTWTDYPIALLAFPSKLLRGQPWTDEKLSFFEFLRGCIDFDTAVADISAPGPLVGENEIEDGIHAAVVERNPRALCDLLELDSMIAGDGVAQSVQPHHFLTAIHTSRDDPTMVKLLVRGNPWSIPCDDPEVTAWAMELSEQDDPFGTFLLHLMQDLPTLERLGHKLFRHGLWISSEDLEREERLYTQAFGEPLFFIDEMKRAAVPSSLERRVWTLAE
ncbi:hypothetical protein VTO42DRAFT_8703 [Malbranchea cinnamomea]